MQSAGLKHVATEQKQPAKENIQLPALSKADCACHANTVIVEALVAQEILIALNASTGQIA